MEEVHTSIDTVETGTPEDFCATIGIKLGAFIGGLRGELDSDAPYVGPERTGPHESFAVSSPNREEAVITFHGPDVTVVTEYHFATAEKVLTVREFTPDHELISEVVATKDSDGLPTWLEVYDLLFRYRLSL